MSALKQFTEAAKSDRPVYISDVRDAFQREGTRPFHFHVTLYDGGVRRFALKVPRCESAEESAFVASFLNAMLYNALSSLGAKRIDIYIDLKDAPLAAWAKELDDTFQVSLPLLGELTFSVSFCAFFLTAEALTVFEVFFTLKAGATDAIVNVADAFPL